MIFLSRRFNISFVPKLDYLLVRKFDLLPQCLPVPKSWITVFDCPKVGLFCFAPKTEVLYVFAPTSEYTHHRHAACIMHQASDVTRMQTNATKSIVDITLQTGLQYQKLQCYCATNGLHTVAWLATTACSPEDCTIIIIRASWSSPPVDTTW